MRLPVEGNARLREALAWVNANDDLYALWIACNVTAIERLGMTDHGPVHVKIVMNLAVRLLRLLVKGGVEPSVVRNYDLEIHDAEIVVALAALFHDLGMSIHRTDHEAYSLFLAQDLLKELLPRLYPEPGAAAIMRSEVLHAIIGHRSGGRPLTLEAGVVRIADALDMAKGRSRIPFEAGSVSIHSVSAAAVEQVTLQTGESKPVRISIEINNSAGVFQLDQLFREKLHGSGLEPYLEVVANLAGEEEKRLFRQFEL
ncbi:MAG: HD domain-containing protein [Gemmatimonadales bacterium]|nr:MAG: HD domain-containing protein [Gemmatimonadales bacterium]